jgi:hypothetical protein
MSRLTDRLERDLGEIAAGASPSPSAWESIVARLGDEAAAEVVVIPAVEARVGGHRRWSVVAAAALVVIAGVTAWFVGIGDDEPVSTADLPAVTRRYVSERNGFSVEYVDGGEASVTPATDRFGADLAGFDFIDTGSSAVFGGTSTLLDESNLCFDSDDVIEPIPCPSADEEIERIVAEVPGACGVARSEQAEITIDGRSGRVVECTDRIEATVVADGWVYLFTLSHDRDDARAVFDALVATVVLAPETAIDYPNLSDTFVSPTYGFSFGSIDRGGIEPATERWDPSNQPVDFRGGPQLDYVDTGFGAGVAGASTPVPDGVSIDEWVDQYVTSLAAGGCGDPRSEQEEVVIDGESGRLAQCQIQVDATVVAGGRLYLFRLYRNSPDRRAMFDEWVTTIDLTPETAAP